MLNFYLKVNQLIYNQKEKSHQLNMKDKLLKGISLDLNIN